MTLFKRQCVHEAQSLCIHVCTYTKMHMRVEWTLPRRTAPHVCANLVLRSNFVCYLLKKHSLETNEGKK